MLRTYFDIINGYLESSCAIGVYGLLLEATSTPLSGLFGDCLLSNAILEDLEGRLRLLLDSTALRFS